MLYLTVTVQEQFCSPLKKDEKIKLKIQSLGLPFPDLFLTEYVGVIGGKPGIAVKSSYSLTMKRKCESGHFLLGMHQKGFFSSSVAQIKEFLMIISDEVLIEPRERWSAVHS